MATTVSTDPLHRHLRDITQTKLANLVRIERLAYTDNLTNLGNRPAFIRNLDERFAWVSATAPSTCCWWTSTTSSGSTTASATQTGDKLLISLARHALRNNLTSGSLARFCQ